MRFSSAGTAAWRRCSARLYPAAFARRAARKIDAPAGGRARRLTRNAVDAPYAKLEQLEPGIARVLAHNPSAFTYYGTQTYLVGESEVAVIDPGPDLPEHLEALERAIGGRPVAAIMCTHTHRDHSPAARPLAETTGAPIIGCAPLALEDGRAARRCGVRRRLSRPTACSPTAMRSRSTAGASPRSRRRATPPTICASPTGSALFTGDHVMGWSTTVVVPPDGDMADICAASTS